MPLDPKIVKEASMAHSLSGSCSFRKLEHRLQSLPIGSDQKGLRAESGGVSHDSNVSSALCDERYKLHLTTAARLATGCFSAGATS